ncbi:hypothetical protein KL86CLO1_10331 [uncultured Eubacteriales bacterium]|uniref:Uncharacterized protein n=1 Tax=uncultured Eubacteriales bacterium TaxID=172733 RepID=A0A212J0V8_9FIRM|nr:hypothetical protein KL86CLO1_10331 [uncultured Eubacteriales bacterium]
MGDKKEETGCLLLIGQSITALGNWKKIDKHNSVIERFGIMKKQMNVASHHIADLDETKA